MKDFEKGKRIAILENGKRIDTGVITETALSPNLKIEEITIESLDLNPRQTSKFALMDDGWKVLFPDPMTGQMVYSARGRSYGIEPIQ